MPAYKCIHTSTLTHTQPPPFPSSPLSIKTPTTIPSFYFAFFTNSTPFFACATKSGIALSNAAFSVADMGPKG